MIVEKYKDIWDDQIGAYNLNELYALKILYEWYKITIHKGVL